MAKRGQRYPNHVNYRWANGIAGNSVADDLDHARIIADRIEATALARELEVTITILAVDADYVRTVVESRTINPDQL